MARWRMTNVTKAVAHWPLINSLSIDNSQPCAIATLDCDIVDEAGTLVVDENDEWLTEYAEDGVTYVDLHAGDVSSLIRTHADEHSGPRRYHLTVQDYTARLSRNVIDRKRNVRETVTARVNWLMGFTTWGTTTTNVATITDEMDFADYRAMTLSQALEEVAAEVGASLYVDSDNDLHFFVLPPVVAAPFALNSNAPSAPTSYSFWGFDYEKENDRRGEAAYVLGDDVKVWRGTQGTYEVAVNDPSIKTLRRAQRVGDRLLAALANPRERGQLTLTKPGLKPLQTVNITEPDWGIADDFLISATHIRALNGNSTDPAEGGQMEMRVEFTDRFQPCRDAGGPGNAGARPPGSAPPEDPETDCGTCDPVVALLPSGMESDLALAAGIKPSVFAYDAVTLVKYRCDLTEVWTATPGTSTPLLFGHESGTDTAVLVAPRAYRTDDGSERWDTSGPVAPTAAQVMDTAHYWQVIDNTGEITFVAADAWQANSVDLPAFAAGDVAIVFAANSISTAPSLPAGWTAIDHRDQAGGSTRLGYRVLQAGDTTTGTWTNGDKTSVFIYRGVNTASPTGNVSYDSGSSSPKIPALTNAAGTSWILGLSAGSSNINGLAVSGLVNRTSHTEDVMPPGTAKILGADTAAGVASFPETAFGTGVWRSWAVELKVGSGGGGGIEGPALQRRAMTDGSLLAEVSIAATTTQIRRTPNGQSVFLFDGTSTMKRYSKAPALIDTITLTGFGTNLEDWNVDNKFNFYRIGSNLQLTKYNQDGEQLWQRTLSTLLTNYKFPTLSYSEGTGQAIMVDDHVRVVGYVGGADWTTSSQAVLLTIGIDLGHLEGVKYFEGDSNDGAQAVAVIRSGACLYVGGVATGTEFEDVTLGATRGWVRRVPD